RLSVTDLCDLRCQYCMPACGVPKLPHDDVLRYEEHIELVRIAAVMGVTKLRITGGEPLIKKGIVHLVREFASTPGLSTLALTTNGQRLAKFAEALKEAGLHRVNVSLDALEPTRYAEITRGGAPRPVIEGIDAALASGLFVRLNSVIIPNLNEQEIEPLFEFAAARGVPLRFIERMGFNESEPFVAEARILEQLGRGREVTPREVEPQSPHVRRARVDGHEVGFISPHSHPFCGNCNKLRITPDGKLRACLADSSFIDVRQILRRAHTSQELREAFSRAACAKPELGPWNSAGEMWRVGG
ncbi:MAG: GTP 3',8-cyclase MoaA, partial [Myxococcota bacterium]|nr:GTP 3',8-cyclase MoaA [Myxococcota bacterium]